MQRLAWYSFRRPCGSVMAVQRRLAVASLLCLAFCSLYSPSGVAASGAPGPARKLGGSIQLQTATYVSHSHERLRPLPSISRSRAPQDSSGRRTRILRSSRLDRLTPLAVVVSNRTTVDPRPTEEKELAATAQQADRKQWAEEIARRQAFFDRHFPDLEGSEELQVQSSGMSPKDSAKVGVFRAGRLKRHQGACVRSHTHGPCTCLQSMADPG